MRTTFTHFAALAAAILLSACAWAQQAPPASPPPAAGAGPCCGPGMGAGQGCGSGARGSCVGSDYTPGWGMMTPQEREAHRQRMSSAKTPQECRKIMDEQRARMEERAKERGMSPMPGPHRDACG